MSKNSEIVRKHVQEQMKLIGFKKSRNCYLKKLKPHVTGVILPTTAYYYGQNGINLSAVVGVRHEFVDEMIAKTGARTQAATCRIQLGYLTEQSNYRNWFIQRNNVSQDLKIFFENIIVFGIPFMERISELEQLVKVLNDRSTDPSGLSLPVAMYFLKQKNEATKLLQKSIERARRKGFGMNDYISSAESLLRLFKS